MIAHELRGPISTIKGLAVTTRTYYDQLPDDEKREFLALIEQESDRMLEIVNQASLAMKLSAGVLPLQQGPADLAAIVREGVGAAGLERRPPGRPRPRRRDDRGRSHPPRRGRAPGGAERRRVLAARRADRGLARARGRRRGHHDRRPRPRHPRGQARARVHDVPELAPAGLRGGAGNGPRPLHLPGAWLPNTEERYPSRARRAGVRCSASGCREEGHERG